MNTTNPNYDRSIYYSIQDDDNLDTIEYPDISNIQMKDQDSFGPPKIDRSSKLAAQKVYNDDEMLRERDRLSEQSLKNKEEALEAEYELRKVNCRRIIVIKHLQKQYLLACLARRPNTQFEGSRRK